MKNKRRQAKDQEASGPRKQVNQGRTKEYNRTGQQHKPAMKWQVGDYERFATYRITLPSQFLLLCKLMEATPEEVIHDFLLAVSCESMKRQDREERIARAREYFMACGYGNEWFTEEDKKLMFRQLDAIGLLWPADARMKLIDLHAKWRKKYHRYWYDKWYAKPRRKI